MNTSNQLANLVINDVQKQDSQALQQHSRELNLLILEQGEISESLFKTVVSILSLDGFHHMQDSFYFIKIFEDNLEYFSTSQRVALLAEIENSYTSFVDETSCLLLAELAAALFTDEQSLQALRHMQKTNNEVARSLVASGYEHFVRLCSDNKLVAQAIKGLREMKTDPSSLVQSEAAESLDRIGANEK